MSSANNVSLQGLYVEVVYLVISTENLTRQCNLYSLHSPDSSYRVPIFSSTFDNIQRPVFCFTSVPMSSSVCGFPDVASVLETDNCSAYEQDILNLPLGFWIANWLDLLIG
jgi:hypothetical protein